MDVDDRRLGALKEDGDLELEESRRVNEVRQAS
jgi:hypothetical protein